MTLPASMVRTMSADTTCGARAPVTSTAPMTTSASRTASATSGDVRIEARDVRAQGARRDQLVAILVEHDDLGAEARGDQRGVAAGHAAAEHDDPAAFRRGHAA